jgi:uncharacterized protein with HEPN domain
MLSEKERGALRDMLRHIDLAEQFPQGRTVESLHGDPMPLYAVIRCLEVISEASRRLSDEKGAASTNVVARDGGGRERLSPQL